MKSAEARDYFRTLGSLHCDIKAGSQEEGLRFLTEEKQTPEYCAALLALKFEHPGHFERGTKKEIAEISSFALAQGEAIDRRIGLGRNLGRINRWLALYQRHVDLTTLMTTFQSVSERLNNDDAPHNSKHVLNLFVFGGRWSLRSLHARQADELGTTGLSENIQRAMALRKFIDIGSINVKVDGVSLNSFVKEDFRSKKAGSQKIIKYLKFFMAVGASAEEANEEELQRQNTSDLIQAYPYSQRNVIREASNLARAFYVFRIVEPRRFQEKFSASQFPPSLFEEIKGVTKAVIDCQQQFIDFSDKLHELVFNPKAEGSAEARNLILGYLDDSKPFSNHYLLSLMGVITAPSLVSTYRKSVDLMEGDNDPVFYELIAAKIKEMAERYKSLDIATADDLDSIITPREITNKPEQVTADLVHTITKLDKNPNWRDINITEMEIPWERIGIRKPGTIKLEYPNGSLMDFSLDLGYQNEYGESLSISLQVDLSKKTFDWSILEAPEKCPDLQTRFLEVTNAIFSEIYFQLNPQERKAQEIIFAPAAAKPKPVRPVRFEGPTKVKAQGVPTPLKLALLDDPAEYKVKDQILVPDNDSVTQMLRGVPVDQQKMIIRRITEFNGLGRGKFKKLDNSGPNGGRQYSLRMGRYRVLLLEQDFSQGARTYTVRDIGHRSEIYDEVDN